MKKLTTLLFSLAFSTAALAEPVPRFEEFLTIMREHNCELTYEDAMQVLVRDAGFKKEDLRDVSRYALDNGIATMINSREDDGTEDLLTLSESHCKG